MRSRRAFTLIELLVVVAILSVLLSILSPSLNRAKELTRRAVCLSSMRNTIQGCLSYAGDERDMLPPSQNSDGSIWAYAFDAKNSANVNQPLGVGLLIPYGHLSDSQLGRALHCPSLRTAGATEWNTPYHSMDVDIANWWNGVGASWWNDPACATRRIVTSYNYRSPSYWRTHGQWQMRSSVLPADLALYLDVLDPRFGGRFAHRDGHNCVRADGSGFYYDQAESQIEEIALADGSPNTDGRADPVSDEAIFELFER